MVAVTTAHAFGLAGVLLFWFLPALLIARLAERKGRSFGVYLIASLILGWPIALIATLIIRPRVASL